MSKEGTKTVLKPAVKTEKKELNKLKAPEGFALVNWNFGPRIDAGKHGIIDLETLTPVRAQRLVDAKFPYLKKV